LCVDSAHGAVVAGVHRLQGVVHLRATHLADDDPLGTHAQTVAHEVAHGDLAFALEIWRPGFETHDVRLLQLKFGRVFAGDDALIAVDIVGKAVEQGGLAGAGTTGNHDVAADAADDTQEFRAFGRNTAEAHQLVEGQSVLFELADGKRGTINRERRNNDVDAGSVGQTRVADRARFIDAAADLADDALAYAHQVLIVTEADVRFLHLAIDLDIDPLGAVHHDVRNIVAREQRFQRTEAQNVVADVLEQLFLLGDRHHEILDRDDVGDDVADFLACALGIELCKLRKIDRVDQRGKDLALGVV